MAGLGPLEIGLIILAILVAGWRCGLRGRDWTWTNVMGWSLGVFWIALAAGSWMLTPGSFLNSLVSR